MNLRHNLSLTTLVGVLAGSVAIGGLAVPGALYLAQSRRPITQYAPVTATKTVTVTPPVVYVTESAETKTVQLPATVRTVTERAAEAETVVATTPDPAWQAEERERRHRREQDYWNCRGAESIHRQDLDCGERP
ncbi:MAG: hypothetical protein M3O70_22730 [Actinomycetota bacterium]|nr:hypothetical protein [Actinomycetota bacterium]